MMKGNVMPLFRGELGEGGYEVDSGESPDQTSVEPSGFFEHLSSP